MRDIYAAFSAKHLAMGRAASMDSMAGSFAAVAWNSDQSVRGRLLLGILCLGIWGLLLMKEGV